MILQATRIGKLVSLKEISLCKSLTQGSIFIVKVVNSLKTVKAKEVLLILGLVLMVFTGAGYLVLTLALLNCVGIFQLATIPFCLPVCPCPCLCRKLEEDEVWIFSINLSVWAHSVEKLKFWTIIDFCRFPV